MQTYKLVMITRTVLLASLLTACSSTPYLDSRFGEAVNMAKAQQTINPDASQNMDPVTGIDGVAAKDSVDRYHESFQKPPSTAGILTIDVLGGGGK
ncbi:hypothetical protein [Vogesella alkaliphila]|uniref:Lipoprotein n=1 Tax=Vogesella alkaliphila TaxID=1193621 RepID=A0ABQ2YLY3_9NEIS|nr:hypothetical protein [Vogesella alkaliphila]GGX88701.1 hypothetical protein GCM10011290_15490 [Vogesella alkaliphila]